MTAKARQASERRALSKLPKLRGRQPADLEGDGPDPIRGTMPSEPEIATAVAALG